MVHEEAKHQERLALLARIEELAEAEDDTKTMERVQKLRQKESGRYARKRERLEKRKQQALQFGKEKEDTAQGEMKKAKSKLKGQDKGKKKGGAEDEQE
jgi:hypothetical protein